MGNGVGLCNTVVCRESRRASCLVLVDASVIRGTASPWQLEDNTEQNLAPGYHHVQWHCVSVDSFILKVSFTRAWPLRLEPTAERMDELWPSSTGDMSSAQFSFVS